MLSTSSKGELGFVHYIAKFTILGFVISRFECIRIDRWVKEEMVARDNGRYWLAEELLLSRAARKAFAIYLF